MKIKCDHPECRWVGSITLVDGRIYTVYGCLKCGALKKHKAKR